MKHTKQGKKAVKEAAHTIVLALMKQAETIFSTKKTDKAAAKRLVRKARRMAMKVCMCMPASVKRRFCKHCYAYLKVGMNCRVRLAKTRVIYACSECKKFMRFPYTQKKKPKKQRVPRAKKPRKTLKR
jgi:RNase P subunit RPR2